MRRNAFLAFTFALAAATSSAAASWRPIPASPRRAREGQQSLPDRHWALLNNYCEKCHNATDWTGGVAFDTMQPSGIPEDAKTWEAAVSKLRGRMMPPPGEKQPDQATIDSFVSWMEGNLDKAAAAHPDAGYVSLHRLNRVEYASAVKDLLSVEVDPTTLLPQDTKSDGFDNVASALKVSPTFLDQYISAARTVAALAVGSAHASQAIVTYRAGPHDQIFHIEGLPLGTRGGLSVLHNFPADGTYTFNLNVGTGLGYIGDLAQEHKVVFLIDGKQVFERSIGGPKDFKDADQKQQEATKEFAARFRGIKLPVTAGPHQLVVTFVQRAQSESDDWLASFNPMGGIGGLPRIGGLEINGPVDVTGLSETPSRAKIFSCRPTDASQEAACAHQILTTLTRNRLPAPDHGRGSCRAAAFLRSRPAGQGLRRRHPECHRRHSGEPEVPVSPRGGSAGGHGAGESFCGQRGQGQHHAVGLSLADLELASRLSFFLWSQGPDEELLSVAAPTSCTSRRCCEVRCGACSPIRAPMRWSPTSPSSGCRSTSIDKIEPDPSLFPDFDEDLRTAFRKEMELFVGSVLLENRSVIRSA